MLSQKGSVELSAAFIFFIVISIAMFMAGITILTLGITGLEKKTEEIHAPIPEEAYTITLQNESATTLEVAQKLKIKEEEKDCLEDFSCDYYFIYVPLGSWEHQKLFKAKVIERANFFIDISAFKFRRVGNVIIPLDFAQRCALSSINPWAATHHLRIKNCADRYADSLGIGYERAIGLINSYSGGRAFFYSRAVYATLGYMIDGVQEERPSLVAHEIGHTYYLCDEYSFREYVAQNRYLQNNLCKNKFPEHCDKQDIKCPGNSPVHREYQGQPVLSVCEGEQSYSVMGVSSGEECGYDDTGGYVTVGGFT